MSIKTLVSIGVISILLILPNHGITLRLNSTKLLLKGMLSRPPNSPEASMSTVEIIYYRGYRAEVHRIITEDSYVLELHRILPRAPKNDEKLRKVVYLHHGMVLDGRVWIVNANENSLAYMLVDRGYDVWLGNSRGTRYSRQHLFLDPKKEEYWDFGWDEMGAEDLPAAMKYILRETKQEKLSYVGYSLGCTIFFIAMIEHPELNNSVDAMFALAPASNLANIGGLLGFLGRIRVDHFLSILRSLQRRAFLSNESKLMRSLTKYVCQTSFVGTVLCRSYIFSIFGRNAKNFNTSSIPVITGLFPAGGSVKTIAQFFQNHHSGEKFHRYNYGKRGNMKHYGSTTPPAYDLQLVKAPIYLYYGDKDPLAPTKDVKWLATQLGNVRELIRVDDPNFTHSDFVWSNEAGRLVYLSIIERLPSS